jgi:hypothetical protein
VALCGGVQRRKRALATRRRTFKSFVLVLLLSLCDISFLSPKKRQRRADSTSTAPFVIDGFTPPTFNQLFVCGLLMSDFVVTASVRIGAGDAAARVDVRDIGDAYDWAVTQFTPPPSTDAVRFRDETILF